MMEYPSWCSGLIAKYGIDSLNIMHDLLRVAYQRGQCSAADIKYESESRHLVGAVFKLAKSCGLYATGECIISDKESRKKGSVRVWRVADHALLERRYKEVQGLAAKTLLDWQPHDGKQVLLDWWAR